MKKFLVVKLSAIGDVIHALPVSYAIKETYPDSHLAWVVEPPARPLLEGNPYIDEIITFNKKEFKSIRGFMKNYGPFRDMLRQHDFDASLDLQGLFKSAAIVHAAGAKKRYGTCNMREMSDHISHPVRGPHRNGHIVDRYLDVARALGCRVEHVKFPVVVSDTDMSHASARLRKEGVPEGQAYAAIAVGANWPNKRWPVEYWAVLCDWLYDEHIIPVLAGGGPVDEDIAFRMSRMMEIPAISLVGKTNLKELAYIMQHARFVIGGDTGPVHLAAGLGTKTIMLMGPTDANRNGPYGQQQNAIEVERACRYCWKRACPSGFDCLAAINVETVKRKIREVLR